MLMGGAAARRQVVARAGLEMMIGASFSDVQLRI
jgi:hypothetical protein